MRPLFLFASKKPIRRKDDDEEPNNNNKGAKRPSPITTTDKIHWMRSIPCSVCHTQGIEAFSDEDREKIYFTVRDFNDFTEANDPHGEHDFGAFDFEGQKIFWKFDYYAHDLKHGSENPADTSQTMRVLTIMLASEY